MTRLTTEDINHIPERLVAYDEALVRKTGLSLKGLACRAWGAAETDLDQKAHVTRVAVIPVSWGQGVIHGFSQSVAAIVEHLGFETCITQRSNVAGLGEAAEKGVDVIMLSDDDHFSAIHFKSGKSVDNSEATGRVFAAGLDSMAGGLEGRNVLLMGCGPVGRSAGMELLRRGAKLSAVDIKRQRARDFARRAALDLNRRIDIEKNLALALKICRFILDATPAADIIGRENLMPDTMVSAPGVPVGLTKDTRLSMGDRVLHDPLQLGTAAMIVGAVTDG